MTDSEPTPRHSEVAQPDRQRDAAEVLRNYLRLIQDQQFDQLVSLYATDAIVTHPLDGAQTVLRGTAELQGHFDLLARLGLQMKVNNLRLHQTTDPETVLAEFDYDGTDGQGHHIHRRNVFVWQVRNGHVIEARDYSHDLLV